MIRLSNGHEIEYACSAGALGYWGEAWPWERILLYLSIPDFSRRNLADKLLHWEKPLDRAMMTVFGKTTTSPGRLGNYRWYKPRDTLRFLPGGTVNAHGWANPGFWVVAEDIEKSYNPKLYALVLNFFSDDFRKLAQMARRCRDLPIVAIEIDPYCPNVQHSVPMTVGRLQEMCEIIRRESSKPVILKLSAASWPLLERIVMTVHRIVEAITINTVPWAICFPDKVSPLAHHGGGGVSGKAAQHINWPFIHDIVEIGLIPVIGAGVWEYEDIAKVRTLGVGAVSFGSIFLRNPFLPCYYIRRDLRDRTLEIISA